MDGILITNETYFDKEHNTTFRYQDKYKSFSIGSDFSTLVPFYQKLLKQVIGTKADETFKDFALSKEQTEKIKTIFEEQIDKTLPVYEDYKGTKIPHKRLEWKGEIYELHLGLNSPNNRKIDDFYKIVTIANECLKENKPMYLSIE
ncbi:MULTISPECIES: hypothetical protein [Flavobacterium]|uniref:Uncharacterized protein n=1 Tax=Flavobacterium hankyongi TaxID=1176532 RepID=A0ABP8ZN17_9FLAO|nr:hypothetical protein [Flavobacterium sp. N1846]